MIISVTISQEEDLSISMFARVVVAWLDENIEKRYKGKKPFIIYETMPKGIATNLYSSGSEVINAIFGQENHLLGKTGKWKFLQWIIPKSGGLGSLQFYLENNVQAVLFKLRFG